MDSDGLRGRATRMANLVRHRGPDEEGVYGESRVALASRRLKVIDLRSGRMPISSEDGNVIAVYNGEIYNHESLRRELQSAGHQFVSSADTEVLVHLYEEHGLDMVHRLEGMFAFALWDARRGQLHLVRDRVGIKPLFYRLSEDELLFGSELKCVVEGVGSDPAIDSEALAEYLALGYVRAPATIYDGCCKLLPGTILSFSRGEVDLRRYWDFPVRENGAVPDPGDAVERLDELLRSAVQKRLMADVPLGSFLSGGVDSSLVVALAARASGERLETFSIGFEGPNELPYARQVAERYDTEHHELVLGPEACSITPKLAAYFDEPFGDASAIPTYHVSELARRHVTVALSGDGGDELFGGYDRYAHDARWAWTEALPSSVRKVLFGLPGRLLPRGWYGRNRLLSLGASREERYGLYATAVLDPEQGGLLHPRLAHALRPPEAWFASAFEAARELPFPARLMYADATGYLPDDILTKVDRMSMAHSLEARVPLLDHHVVEFAASLPVSLKLNGKRRKWLLKKLAERYLPPEILDRPKQGFSLPIDRWLRRELSDSVELLTDGEALSREYLHAPTVGELVAEHQTGRRDHSNVLWRLLSLELWLQSGAGGGVATGKGTRRPDMESTA